MPRSAASLYVLLSTASAVAQSVTATFATATPVVTAFLVDVQVCPRCGGERKVLAAIHDPAAIRKVLEVLGLSAEVLVLAAARSPPRQDQMEFG